MIPKAAPVVEVHSGGKGISRVHDRADAGCKEGHTSGDVNITATVDLGCGGSVGFSRHAPVYY